MTKPRTSLGLSIVILVFLVSCAVAEPPATATCVPPTEMRTAVVTPTRTATHTPTALPPTATLTPESTATPVPPTATRIPPTATRLPATHSVCASGCDFTTIQAAVDATGTAGNAIIQITGDEHTEAGIVIHKGTAVTIRGARPSHTVVQAHDTQGKAPERVFLVEEDARLVLERLTVRHGRPSNDEACGGGILNLGSLTLRQCSVETNQSNSGAGICTRGTLTVINSTIRDNLADGVGPSGYECGSGAGIKCERGALALMNSTVSGNTSEDADIHADRARGGGVHVACNCTAVFTNSTISGNTSVAYAGGVYVRGHLDMVNTLMAHNPGKGGNCVVGGPGGYQGKGEIGLNWNNLIVGGSCDPAFTENPDLGPLADNGGDTSTHALSPGSPAIDAVPAVSCTLPTDQRGSLRPAALTSPDAPCDIGAFEAQALE